MKEKIQPLEFFIGDCASVSIDSDGFIDMSFLAHFCDVDDVPLCSNEQDATLVNIGELTKEKAYLLGKALLAVAKEAGIDG